MVNYDAIKADCNAVLNSREYDNFRQRSIDFDGETELAVSIGISKQQLVTFLETGEANALVKRRLKAFYEKRQKMQDLQHLPL